MAYLLFFSATIAACLLWSAACTAAAAQTDRPWLRRLLIVAAVAAPVVALLPWLIMTAWLAWRIRIETNWFGPTLTATLAALVGGAWIARAGLARRLGLPAAGWPVLGLAVGFLVAKCVAAGALFVIDHDVVSLARFQRLEAAAVMQAALPPLASPADDAAPLYLDAFRMLDTDPSLSGAESPLKTSPREVDASSNETADLVTRHAATLDLLRRAADRGGCRFVRDWSRPSMDMILPEMQSIREAAWLLALAVRREAADGKGADALRDIERLHRMAMHVAGEPILVSGLVGLAIDKIAVDCLAEVLPKLTKSDLAALDTAGFRDFLATPISISRHVLGEEAFALSLFADLIDPRSGKPGSGLEAVITPGLPLASVMFLQVFRGFLLPADIAAYRGLMERLRTLATSLKGRSFADIANEAAAIGAYLPGDRRPGIVTGMLVPAVGSVLKSQAVGQARHRAAEVAVAATRQRLESGSLPESPDELVPRFLAVVPRDPFTTDAPLLVKQAGGAWLVYSVGPNGKDDGGPVAAGVEKPADNDDVGLRLAP